MENLIFTSSGLIVHDFRLPAGQIAAISLKGVFLHKSKNKRHLPKIIKKQLKDSQSDIIGRNLFDNKRVLLRNISDIILENKHISALELSRGMYENLCIGRERIELEGLKQIENGFTME